LASAPEPVLPLDAVDLAIAAALVLVAGVTSVLLHLRLEKDLLIASVRTVVQLLLIGYLLEWLFGIDEAPLVLGVLGVMVAAAGQAALARSSRTFRGAYGLTFVSLLITGMLTTFTVTGAIIEVSPWYRPQYVIPLFGMVLGNGLTGISLTLSELLEALAERRELVEMELALGASRWEAARDVLSHAVRRGMVPIINSMMVVGVVSLPGMMTGQILGGSDPLTAVKYQIVVMFMLAAATALGCTLVALLVYGRLFNLRHQLRAELIRRRKG
jgi:putative ABC transport system permease protein